MSCGRVSFGFSSVNLVIGNVKPEYNREDRKARIFLIKIMLVRESVGTNI